MRRGFKIEKEAARGNDEGADLIIIEPVSGIITKTKHRWLVSCKHTAHSNKAVADHMEINTSGRLKRHNCHGFLGFYSVGPAESLIKELKSSLTKEGFLWSIYNYTIIENEIFENMEDHKWLETHFNNPSINDNNSTPPIEVNSLECQNCFTYFQISDEGATLTAWGHDSHSDVFAYACSMDCSNHIDDLVLQSNWDEDIYPHQISFEHILSPIGYRDFYNDFQPGGDKNKSASLSAKINIEKVIDSIDYYFKKRYSR